MKKVFYAIIFLIVLYFVFALFGPSEVKVERRITINAPSTLVKEKLGDFRYFHEMWSPWTAKDPLMEVSYSGNPGEEGHRYVWSGNKEVGAGEILLVRYHVDSLVQKVSFKDQGDAMAYYLVNDAGHSTDVIWGMHFNVDFLFRTPMMFMDMETMMGRDLEEGLVKLKQAVEAEDGL